eukprot:1871827-Amphidinium_carterae.1
MNKADELHVQEHGQVEEEEQPYDDVGEDVCEEARAETTEEPELEAEQELRAAQAVQTEVAAEVPRTSPQQMSRFLALRLVNPSQRELANVQRLRAAFHLSSIVKTTPKMLSQMV